MITVSYKHPKLKRLIYKQFENLRDAPKEIIRNGKIYLQYGVHN